MRISDRYIARQIIVATLFAVLFLTVILVMGTVMKEIRLLLVDLNQSVWVIFQLILGAFPASLIYTIPWAFLAAVLLVVGRMSSDQEITGFRVSGVSLRRLMLPIFAIGALLSLLSMWLNVNVAPRAWAHTDEITFNAFVEDPQKMLAAAAEHDALDRLEEHLRGTKAFIGKYQSEVDVMDGLHIFRPGSAATDAKAKTSTVYFYAKGAKLIDKKQKGELSLHLYDAVFTTTDKNGAPQVAVMDEAIPVTLPFQSIREMRMKPKFLTNQEIRNYVSSDAGNRLRQKSEAHYVEFVTEIYRRFGSSFACLAFAFVGVPLGIKARRRDTSTGLLLSLIIGTAYFAISAAKARSLTSGMMLAWGPDVVCVLLGLYLLRRARFR